LFALFKEKYSFAPLRSIKSNLVLMFRFFLFTILLFSGLSEKPVNKTIFISPVKIPLSLSANFGELRADHFHSGLDIRTQGVTGKEVVAAASGYIYRIGVSPGGFGKALYVRHPSGYSTVYAHLESFVPEIAEFVKEMQYERKSFPITLFPDKEKFPVEQGELIAYSGNSGSSGGPHLHYEIRNSANENPVNPLLFDFGVEDNIKPVFEQLVIYPQSRKTIINSGRDRSEIRVTGSNGNFTIPGGNRITINGPASFGIKSYDMLNNSGYKFSVHSVELSVDSTVIYRYGMDDFSFAESRYINSHIDYEAYMQKSIYYERMFLLPNNRLRVYNNVKNRGIYNFSGLKDHNVKVVIKDTEGNQSVLNFQVLATPADTVLMADTIDSNLMVMPFGKSNKFISDSFILEIPPFSLYDTCYFDYKEIKDPALPFSSLHQVHNIYTPVHKTCRLYIKPDSIPAGKTSKLLVLQKNGGKDARVIGGEYTDGYVTAELRNFGSFYIGIDTVPPVISPNGLADKADLSGRKDIKVKITDDLSGIRSYETYIDGKWALAEYDPKYNLLIYEFDPERITKGVNHSFTLRVTDNKDNSGTFKCSFKW
jgi:hypothetical protein